MPRTAWTQMNSTDYVASINGHQMLASLLPDGRANFYFNGRHRGTRMNLRDAQAMLTHLGNHTSPTGETIISTRPGRVTNVFATYDVHVSPPSPSHRLMSSRTFGIELEYASMNTHRDNFANVARNAGLDVQSMGYTHETTSYWKIVTDSTVSWGEIVSPVLQGEHGLINVQQMANVISANDARVSTNCGYHVHFGVKTITDANSNTAADLEDFRNVCLSWARAQYWLQCILSLSRRNGSNGYCRQNPVYNIESIREANSLEAIRRAIGTDRYLQLNTNNIGAGSYHRNTIEVRAHQGTANPTKIIQWLRLLDAIFAANETTMPAYPQRRPTQDEFRAFLVSTGAPIATIEYWLRRAIALRTLSSPRTLRNVNEYGAAAA